MERKALIEFRGSIKYETIGELIHRFKMLVPAMGIQIGTYKRILLILIESLENMMKHSENPISDESHSLLTVFQAPEQFIISTQNSIKTVGIDALKTKIDFLNSLDQQGLKNVYKETITNGVFTSTGGAGLGLIEIARISGNPIQYSFTPLDNAYSIYQQEVIINIR